MSAVSSTVPEDQLPTFLRHGHPLAEYLNSQQIQPYSKEWYEYRKSILTSTKVAGKLGLSQVKDSPDSAPLSQVTDMSDPLQWGTALESVAREHISKTLKTPVHTLGLRTVPGPAKKGLGATPDGIYLTEFRVPRLVEIKCPIKRKINYYVPVHYWVQVQIAMEVWDINECLYCEYEFAFRGLGRVCQDDESVVSCPFTDNVLGYVTRKNFWHYVIYRDRDWYHSVYGRLCVLNTNKVEERTKRGRDFPDPGIVVRRQHDKNSVNVQRLRNYVDSDPVLDVYELQGVPKGNPRFEDFQQENWRFKLKTISRVLFLAKESKYSVVILSECIDSLLGVYKNNVLIKYCPDLNVIDETQEAMQSSKDVIVYGQLARRVTSGKSKRVLYTNFDLIIKSSLVRELLGIKGLESDASPGCYPDYTPINIKAVKVECRLDGCLSSKHKPDSVLTGFVAESVLYGLDDSGVAPYSDRASGVLLADALSHVNSVKSDSVYYPNMKNSSRYMTHKKSHAKSLEELTQVAYLGYKTRQGLHANGVYKISDILPEHLNGIPYESTVRVLLGKDLVLPKIPKPSGIEAYLDFESLDQSVYIAGVFVSTPEDLLEREQSAEYYKSFKTNLGEDCAKQTMDFLAGLNYPVTVYHWSHAELSLLTKACVEIPSNCILVDLCKLFKESSACVPGAYGYGLKAIAKGLHAMGKIETSWVSEATVSDCFESGVGADCAVADGFDTVEIANYVRHKCTILGTEFVEDPLIGSIAEYNYVDCKVMYDIVELCRKETK